MYTSTEITDQRLAAIVFSTKTLLRVAAALAFLFGALAAWRGRLGHTTDQLVTFTLIPWALAAAGVVLSRSSREVRRNATAAIVSTALALYMAEVLLLGLSESPRLGRLAGGRVLWSPESRLEAIRERRRADPNVFPIIPAQTLKTLMFDPPGVQPLGPTVGLSTAVLCNETGPVVAYRADRYGLNNPDSQWDQGEIEMLVVGDSYTQGVCVGAGQGLADHLRTVSPTLINLGLMGSGPLTELAILKEYGAEHRPKTVLWIYYEGNDLIDLRLEQEDDVLPHYLDREYSQHLTPLRHEIDGLMRAHLDSLVDHTPSQEAPRASLLSLARRAAGLRTIRAMAGIRVLFPSSSSPLEQLPDVLGEAKRIVEGWGGDLVLVYLPAYERFSGWIGDAPRGHPEVLALADSLHVQSIDLEPLFRSVPDPRSLWVRPDAHLTPEAYALIAERIVHQLGIPATPSP